jgi:hypothetical protein
MMSIVRACNMFRNSHTHTHCDSLLHSRKGTPPRYKIIIIIVVVVVGVDAVQSVTVIITVILMYNAIIIYYNLIDDKNDIMTY